jgi:hypothetical protein
MKDARIQPRGLTSCGGGPCRSLPASERPAKPAGRIPETLIVLPLERSLASCRGFAPFAGGARSHKACSHRGGGYRAAVSSRRRNHQIVSRMAGTPSSAA